MKVNNLISKSTVIVFILSFVVFVGNFNFVLGQDAQGEGLTVSISTEKHQYIYGEKIAVQGIVYNGSTGEPVKAKILIQITRDDVTLYRTSKFTSEDGTYHDDGYIVTEINTLKITSNASLGGYNGTAATSIVTINHEDILDLVITYFLPFTIAVVVLIYLILLMSVDTKDLGPITGKLIKPRFFVATEFIFLTLFTLCIISSVIFTTRPIGAEAPFGLVQCTYENQTQWVINLGGIKASNTSQYVGGVQIPIYVIMLSILGAYIYFLSHIKKLVQEKDKELLMNRGLNYLVRFFIAPSLAIALYLVLWQMDVKGQFTLAAVSFAVGLIIKDVIDRIVKFAKDIISPTSTSAPTS